jgi:UDP-glucose 4-epimerase
MLTHKFPEGAKPLRVVLLGAGGFLAPESRRLIEQNGVPVHAIGGRELDLTGADASEKLAALLRPDDAVVMAAALTPDKGRDIGMLMKNLRMGENVCAAIGRLAPAHFVYISSDGVYDARFSSLLNEDSTCEPTDLYTLMHIAREKMLEQVCRATGIPLAVVRPCAIYGPGDTHNSYGPNRFIRTACKDGKITLFGGGEERRHHVYVTDVARIINLCLLHRSTGAINAVTGEAGSFRDIAETIVAAVGRSIAFEYLPRASAVTHRHFDVTALATAFPEFAATPLETGISRSVEAMLRQA